MLEFCWGSFLWNLIIILPNVVMVYKKLPVLGSLWLGFGIIACHPCSFIVICPSKVVCVSILHVLSACFRMVSSIFPLYSIPCQSFWLPSSRISPSVCFHATSPVVHSKDILWFPSYSILACSQYPSPKFAVVFLQVLHTFSGYSVFHLPVCIHVQPMFLWWRLSQQCSWRFQVNNAVWIGM